MNRALSYPVLLMIGFAFAPAVAAHEMFLKPEVYRPAPASTATIELVNGTFERSDNVIDRDRMRDVSVHGGGATLRPAPEQWSERGMSTLLRFETGAPGTYAVGVSTKPRMITLSAQSFTDYLRHEGVADALADFEAHGALEEVRERYSKHVRTIIRVGDAGSGEHQTAFGYPVEIILDADPYEADVGDAIGFQVLADGEPLAGQLVYASHDEYRRPEGDGAHHRAQTLRTDANGRAALVITEAGVWYLTLIHMKKLTDDPEADYESNWATVTFAAD